MILGAQSHRHATDPIAGKRCPAAQATTAPPTGRHVRKPIASISTDHPIVPVAISLPIIPTNRADQAYLPVHQALDPHITIWIVMDPDLVQV